ncbi:aromatic ring-hydroxylating oxygenase subunit alpha [Sandaracinobacteroides saxicola]|uniref:Aromatic ring-hydroxylating dioxygenase subunit alpha n=1 Tax=Sandaracinobacteroides saxicola TaxID=2759707 RepID=A0A7G5IKH4_9SPHN|nr:aromatic ring-hydroxylating dioxygenase subunit alpha [Sandaracinobacteroides saxicola]QMW23866.1 aromatic ring-hydroxylating dioxygenase subunit alpha [Sandaracinobacteroides saxicola]
MADADGAGARAWAAQDLQRRMVARAAAGTTEMAAAPMRVAASAYTCPERFERERVALFRRMPLVAGLSRDLPAPGDVMRFEAAGPSIIVARGKDGVVRAFRNLCTHRGAKLLTGEEGVCEHRARLTCPFHAWTFDLEGRLVGQPGKAGFDGGDALWPVACEERHGVIFVQPEGAMDLDAHLGELEPVLAMLELGGAEPVKRGHIDAATNWKYALDTYGEGYHFASLHPGNIGITHISDVAVVDELAPFHHRVSFPTKAMAALRGVPEAAWPAMDYGGVHYLFPNTVIFVGAVEPGKTFVQLFRLFPESVGQMRCQFAVYAPGGVRDATHRAEVAMAYDMTEAVVRTEDYRVAAEAFANLREAPAGFELVLGRNEGVLQRAARSMAAISAQR